MSQITSSRPTKKSRPTSGSGFVTVQQQKPEHSSNMFLLLILSHLGPCRRRPQWKWSDCSWTSSASGGKSNGPCRPIHRTPRRDRPGRLAMLPPLFQHHLPVAIYIYICNFIKYISRWWWLFQKKKICGLLSIGYIPLMRDLAARLATTTFYLLDLIHLQLAVTL